MLVRCIRKENITAEQRRRCVELMAPERRGAVERITHVPTRENSICGEWLAKTMLAALGGVPVEEIHLARDGRGKPYVIGLPLYFSISHSGGHVACAVDAAPVGLDVEERRPRDTAAARRVCSPQELAFIFADEEGASLRFLQVWTAKEACVKLSGVGLGGMREADFFALRPRLATWEEDGCIISVVRQG